MPEFAAPPPEGGTAAAAHDAASPLQPGAVDPDLELEPGEGRPPTALEDLLADFTEAEPDRRLTLEVPQRPGYAVVYRVSDVSYEQVQAWRRRARDDKMPGGTNEAQAMAITLAALCEGIIRRGVTVTEAGEPVTFATPSFQALLARGTGRTVARAADAVRALYDADGQVIVAGMRVLEAAGFGRSTLEAGAEEVDETAGPTRL